MHSVRSCKPSDARKRYVLFFFSMLLAAPCFATDALPSYLEQEAVPATKYHLTARPWQPLGAAHYLDIVEDVARFWAAHEDPHLPGRIVDPVPYDAWLQTAGVPQVEMGSIPLAIGVLLKAGRGGDLRDFAIRVMDYETHWYYEHTVQHGALEWGSFVQFQLSAFEVLDALASIPQAKKSQWRNRLSRTNSQLGAQLAQDGSMNSYCYRMLAEWDRYRLGLAFDRSTIVKAIEGTWRSDYPVVRNLIVPMRWNLFSDVRPAPLSLSTEAAGRVPLLLLVDASGYDGPSAGEIRAAVERGTHTMLFLQNPVGEGPPNGRTDNHLWVDAGNAAAMEVLAERTVRRGNSWLAGQFRRSAMLTLSALHIGRFRRGDGSYFVTKNHFDPGLWVSYQGAMGLYYNSVMMAHVAQAYAARQTHIPEHPAPSEIGGYALTLDQGFSASVAAAGGMMLQVNTRGEPSNPYIGSGPPGNETYDSTTPLGVVRFGRMNWDTRLGPGDGWQTYDRREGVSFAPTLLEGDSWTRLASLPDRYHGSFSVEFAHPLLVRAAVDYTGAGPSFRNEFIITPDGIVSVTTGAGGTWGMTVPLNAFDGEVHLHIAIGGRIARTSFPGGSDEQTFIALNPSATLVEEGGTTMRSPYGDLRPIRVRTAEAENRLFIYPRSAGDPSADALRDSFVYHSPTNFSSILGRVSGNLYVGRTSAGGVGDRIDIDGDGTPDATFSAPCGFILQLQGGAVTMVEADQDVTAMIAGRPYSLSAYTPLRVDAPPTPTP